MKYIVYKTTCLINNKIYIGVHKTVRDAKEKLNLKLSSISSALKLNRQCNGFLWTRSDCPPDKINV